MRRVGSDRRRAATSTASRSPPRPRRPPRGADAVVIVTEWPQLADVDWAAVGATMRTRGPDRRAQHARPGAAARGRVHGRRHRPRRRGRGRLMEAIVLAGGKAERMGDADRRPAQVARPGRRQAAARLADRPAAPGRRRPRDRQLLGRAGAGLRGGPCGPRRRDRLRGRDRSGSAAAARSASRPRSARRRRRARDERGRARRRRLHGAARAAPRERAQRRRSRWPGRRRSSARSTSPTTTS